MITFARASKLALKPTAELLVRAAVATFGVWQAVGGSRAALPLSPDGIKRILLIRLDLLGDAAFTEPAISAVTRAYPDAEVDILALPYAAPLFRALPGVRRVVELDVNRFRTWAGLFKLGTLVGVVRDLRRQRYDLALSFSRWMGGVFAALSGAPLRAGPAAETYPGAYNLPLPGRRYAPGEHEVDYCLKLVERLSGRPSAAGAVPHVDWPDTPDRFGLPDRYVVVIPGVTNGSAKRWPIAYWLQFAETLADSFDLDVVFCGSAGDAGLLEGAQLAGPRVRDLMGKTSLVELVDLLRGAIAVFGGDTGPLHVAAALGRPVVGLFGPSDPANTGPRGARALVLRAGIACSPCYDLRSPAECKLPDRSVACMWQLEPHLVLGRAQAVFGDLAAGAHSA